MPLPKNLCIECSKPAYYVIGGKFYCGDHKTEAFKERARQMQRPRTYFRRQPARPYRSPIKRPYNTSS